MAAVLCLSPLGSAANYIVDWRCDSSICIPVICVPPYTYYLVICVGDTHITSDVCIPFQYGCRVMCISCSASAENY